MISSKIIDLLKTFTKDEFKEFGKFLNSPYFNSEKVIITLYNSLKKYHPHYSTERFNKQNFFKKLYPERKYDDVIFRNILSKLYRLARQFLIEKGFEKDILTRNRILLHELNNRQLTKLFMTNIKEADNSLESLPVRDEKYYFHKYLLENEKRSAMQSQTSRSIYRNDNIQEISDNLLYYFLTEYTKLLAIMANQKKHVFDHNFRFEFMDEVDAFLESHPDLFEKIPYINIFHKSLKLFITEKEEYFHVLRSLIKQHFDILNKYDQRNVYVVLVNYCSEKIKKGNLKYFNEKFELYKEFIENGAHYEGKSFMSHLFYSGVVSNTLEIGELEWAENFINTYREKLDMENRDSCSFYCLAKLSYERREYDDALKYLARVKMLDAGYKTDVNILQLMIYYDTDSVEPFYSLTDSFRHLLSKNPDISQRRKKLNIEFISFARQLFRIKTNPLNKNTLDISGLKKAIENNNYISGKIWLLRKADELS